MQNNTDLFSFRVKENKGGKNASYIPQLGIQTNQLILYRIDFPCNLLLQIRNKIKCKYIISYLGYDPSRPPST